MGSREHPLVSVCCLVYNHAPFLRECFEGFVMQKTNFSIEILVHDDASTDGSQEIIKEYTAKYPTLFKPIYQKENQYSKGGGIMQKYLYPRAKGKYIALCEGDDYWTDPYKLQKQVDFLETHLDYSLCCHRYRIYNQNTDTWEDDYVAEKFKEFPDGFSFSNKENFECWITKTMTLMFRASEQLWKSFQQYSYTRDVHLNYHLLKQGKGYCFPWDGAVYRRHEGGVFALKDVNEKQYVQYIIIKEIWQKNKEDIELNDYWQTINKTYFDSLRSVVCSHHLRRIDIKRILYFLKDDTLLNGYSSLVWDLKKLLLSYVKGFNYGK